MRKKPDIINLRSDLKRQKGFLFWLQEEGTINLYRIELKHGSFKPVKFTPMPNIEYKNPEKCEHMLNFLRENDVCFKYENNNIFILDRNFKEYKVVEAPLYIRKDEEYCYLKESKYCMEFPTKETLDASYEVFERLYEKIRQEEIIFDFYKLSMDGGISAYMEDYRIPLSYLDKNVFYIFDIGANLNSGDEPYNEYTKTYSEDSILKSQNKVIFNRDVISKQVTEDGELFCYLPKPIASAVIGKEGCNIKNLIYKLGVNKLSINPPFPLKRVI